jgi:hypothetical protein
VTASDERQDDEQKEPPKGDLAVGKGRKRWGIRRVAPARPSHGKRETGHDPFQEKWDERIQGLEMRIGYLRLPSWRFPAEVLDVHHSMLPPVGDGPDLPTYRYAAGIDAIVVYSQPVLEDLPRLTFDRSYLRYVPGHFLHCTLDLSGSFDDYLRSRSSRTRHELLRKTKKFKAYAEGTAECRLFSRPEEMEEFHELALSVARKTYQARFLNVAIPEGPEYRQRLIAEAGKGLVRGFLLFHGSRPIAYGMCWGRDHVLYYAQTGFDPEYRKWSPGIVLLHEMLDQLFSEGSFAFLDFGSGSGHWKTAHATRQTQCANVYYFRWRLKNLLLLVMHTVVSFLHTLLAGLLDRVRLKGRLKRFLHSRSPGQSKKSRRQ